MAKKIGKRILWIKPGPARGQLAAALARAMQGTVTLTVRETGEQVQIEERKGNP